MSEKFKTFDLWAPTTENMEARTDAWANSVRKRWMDMWSWGIIPANTFQSIVAIPVSAMSGAPTPGITNLEAPVKLDVQFGRVRIGEGSTVVVDGDTKQSDLKEGEESGLSYAVRMAQRHPIRDTVCVKMTKEDIVRSGICQDWVNAFEAEAGIREEEDLGLPLQSRMFAPNKQ